MTEEQLRQRIQLLMNALSDCRDPRQRETLIDRLLDTQDQADVSEAGTDAATPVAARDLIPPENV